MHGKTQGSYDINCKPCFSTLNGSTVEETSPTIGSGIIQAGAVKEFKGLSSLYGFPKIRVTVTAFLENGQVVGKGSITKKPPD
jgi:hypothetical protein